VRRAWWAAHEASVAAEEERLAGIAARADQQHAWVMAGDPRGTYGAAGTVATEGNRIAAQPAIHSLVAGRILLSAADNQA
jgi:hypothetical protein